MGLKAGGADDYFGLIYIGDTGEFKKLVESDRAGIVLEEDVISDSLFDVINRRDSKTNILIGAKKFMEGWNSWRVQYGFIYWQAGRLADHSTFRPRRAVARRAVLKRSAALGDHIRSGCGYWKR